MLRISVPKFRTGFIISSILLSIAVDCWLVFLFSLHQSHGGNQANDVQVVSSQQLISYITDYILWPQSAAFSLLQFDTVLLLVFHDSMKTAFFFNSILLKKRRRLSKIIQKVRQEIVKKLEEEESLNQKFHCSYAAGTPKCLNDRKFHTISFSV